MEDIKKVQNLLKKYNQEHVLNEFEELNDNRKEELINQILNFNFDKINKLYENIKKKKELNEEIKIEPIDYIEEDKIEKSKKEVLEKIGEEVIKNNQYAVVTMAGGNGTRLGVNGPKGTYKLDIGENGKYIFEILTETLKKSKEKYGVLPYWYIMTGQQTDEQTTQFFEKHNFFGYDKEKVKFFKQGELPLLTENGKIVFDKETKKIKTGSDGNGGVYQALEKEQMLDDMKQKNIKWVYLCGVDNIMVNPISPVLIGLTIEQNMQIASKSIVKEYPEEKVGTFCKRNGRPDVIEYIELSEEMRNARNENGELLYGESVFISHLFSIEALEECAKLELEYHLAIKNNLYKFEKFYFDVFKYFNNMLVMRVKREKEFAPIKNKEGVDSPKTAKEIYEKNLKDSSK